MAYVTNVRIRGVGDVDEEVTAMKYIQSQLTSAPEPEPQPAAPSLLSSIRLVHVALAAGGIALFLIFRKKKSSK